MIIDSTLFYSFIDKNLYLKRNEKLKMFRQLNFIVCNSNGYTSVMYDKEKKKSQRKIIINFDTYRTMKVLYETEVKYQKWKGDKI